MSALKKFKMRVVETCIYEGYAEAEDWEEAEDIARHIYADDFECINDTYGDYEPNVEAVDEEDADYE